MFTSDYFTLDGQLFMARISRSFRVSPRHPLRTNFIDTFSWRREAHESKAIWLHFQQLGWNSKTSISFPVNAPQRPLFGQFDFDSLSRPGPILNITFGKKYATIISAQVSTIDEPRDQSSLSILGLISDKLRQNPSLIWLEPNNLWGASFKVWLFSNKSVFNDQVTKMIP